MVKLYRFTRTNAKGDSFSFYGQGETRAEAEKEGIENCQSTFRPKQDGRKGKPGEVNGLTRISVRRASGEIHHCSYQEWLKL
jgi:hypothetical protein